VSVPVLSPATAETRPQTAQVQPSGCRRRAAPSEENFDLANISGGEEEDQHSAQAQPLIDTETMVPEVDSGINNPDIVVARDSKNQADDVAYFYDKFIEGYECKFCRYEFLHH
jgi:hypothetical protein